MPTTDAGSRVRAGEEPSRAGHTRRISSLDGLRGIAALIVAFHHSMLSLSASLDLPYIYAGNWPRTGSFAWWLSDTPLHIVWAGPEMVIVFFVLSGYVLALPAVHRGFSWFDSSYYPRRLFRLYIPVWFALVLGVCLHELHKAAVPGASPWLNGQDGTAPLSLQDGLWNASLIHLGSTNAFDEVIWTLKYEVEFSLLLPAFLALPISFRRNRSIGVATSLVSVAVCYWLMDRGTHTGAYTLRLMPVFYLGVLLAFNMDSLRVRTNAWATLLLTAAAVCLLTASYWWTNADSSVAIGDPYLLDVTGACLTVWLAVTSSSASRALATRPVHWLGSRSFSLYLVHEPIVVAFAFLFVRHNLGWFTIIVGVPVALLVADIFWRLVESPSIRTARSLGLQCARIVGSLRPRSKMKPVPVSNDDG